MINKQNCQLVLYSCFIIFIIGCDEWVEGYDDDPNSTQEASMDNLLTASQVNVFNFSEAAKDF